MGQRIITCLIAITLCLGSLPAQASQTKSKYSVDNPDNFLYNVEFNSLDGTNLKMTDIPSGFSYEDLYIELFSTENPLPIKKAPKSASLPKHLPIDELQALLALYYTNILPQVGEKGSNQYNTYRAATQVAVWKLVSPTSQNYKLIMKSVNENIMTLADSLIEKVTESLAKKPTSAKTLEFMVQKPDIKIDSSNAKGNFEDNFNYYGPYKVISTDKTSIFSINIAEKNAAVVDQINGTTLSEVPVNKDFYVRFDNNLISNINIEFVTEYINFYWQSYVDRIAMIPNKESLTVELNIASSVKTGTITYQAIDPVTQTYLSGITVTIYDNETNKEVYSMTTDVNGTAVSKPLQANSYRLEEVYVPTGFSISEPRMFTINGIGDTQHIISELASSDALVTFKVSDSGNNSPVGGSIFRIHKTTGELVKRIGIQDNGLCENIKLSEGWYFLIEEKSPLTHQLKIEPIKFQVSFGKSEVSLTKEPSLTTTSLYLKYEDGTPITEEISILKWSSEMITTVMPNEDGIVKMPLPVGEYRIKCRDEEKSFTVLPLTEEQEYFYNFNKSRFILKGMIMDDLKTPIQDVYVEIFTDKNLQEKPLQEIYSDFNGYYIFNNINKNEVYYVRYTVLSKDYEHSQKVMKLSISDKETVQNIIFKKKYVPPPEEVIGVEEEDKINIPLIMGCLLISVCLFIGIGVLFYKRRKNEGKDEEE